MQTDHPSPPPDDDAEAPSSAFGEALNEFEAKTPAPAKRPAKPLAPGRKVHGTVVSIADTHALIDIGARSEAVADLAPFRNEDGTLRIEPGQTLDLFVVEVGDQITLAPALRSDRKAGLDRMREARAAGMPVEGRVTGVNTGGLEVDLGGVRGFCPVSQVELGYCAEPASYVGRTLEFVVTQVEDKRRSVVLSRRELLRRAAAEEAKQRIAALKVGDELDGTVRKLEAFGAFVDLGGVDGLVHVSEIRHERLAHPRDALREGEKVRVKVLRIEPGKDGRTRIALSIRATAPDPWTTVATQFSPGQRVQGRVARLAEFGAFVTLAPGIDGLVHVSELAPQRVERVKDVIQVGQEVEALVQSVDPAKRRISLSIKALNAPDEEEAPPQRARTPREGAPRERAPRERAPRDRAPSERAPRDRAPRDRGPREREPREREPRSGSPKQPPFKPATPAPDAPRELTTMAIALREAQERARKKAEGGGS